MTTPVLTGSATLDPAILVDSLVPDVIDGLREELQPTFGIRAYRAYRVVRTWSGRVAGDGTSIDVGAELRPQPRVKVWDGLQFTQAICGIRELGDVKLTEVSLTYTDADLTGQPLARNQEMFLAIGEANGQGSPLRVWCHTQPPFIDREKDMGWVLHLRRVEAAPPWTP
ncbi:MAG TPA: hypothetical protein VLN57_21145 [Xanthobacteraceae bacterium]|nr:hypothetical protein [Xanthobacteraceae bacterium]